MSGGPVPKYTQGSRGIWEKIRQLLVIVPNRSTGNPVIPLYRSPPPGQSPNGKYYEDPHSIPAGDIVENTYFNRDSRRNYPQLSSFDQFKISGLLKIGNSVEPRVSIGEKGLKELALVQDPSNRENYLSNSLKTINQGIIDKQVLGDNGVIVAPSLGITQKRSVHLVNQDEHGMYPENYPVRIFNYR
ncbi:NADH-ubiquinone oxidoreductase 21.3 kDa subunit [Wickerhamomyces ciferrii]|uniref:NADH-ubiquinone oxidoreductase 21.3 kDa subunit n=1 Tax=Wickerhamomyces ciferrii (strain ATCC 14091 / BCRC 22168 / CBS 111 / JCM 3599 / NBRC 0793 / NRRL Y-1031 F-60-10) TaxID=1206466 RepID=K0KPC0_WICCF|nr:NADH-ubiquinone oxidoreductase 21.3 kDa subunit [Wickerhamomyces ciferrii]CCH42988.1 NADH-ubiquinone oxidoreductase 21.3 kDa subunit [Wickerhamomyces ciferrii]